MANSFYENIKKSIIEREVEDCYNEGIKFYFPSAIIEHPFACDGLISTKTEKNNDLRLIMEYKLDKKLKSSIDRSGVLAQVIFYLKRFEENGVILPNVCFVCDINECFVIHVNELIPFLSEDIDWKIAPSNAYILTEFVQKISDSGISPFVWDVNENFKFEEVIEKINNLADDIKTYVHVTEHNVASIFEYFCKNVIKNSEKLQSNNLVAAFIGTITDRENYYQHPSKKNKLVTPSFTYEIKGENYEAFVDHFNTKYTRVEKDKFAEISDRLIEDTTRRRQGEFYTPTPFVDYAHKMISEELGEDWKERCVVWDNSCGSCNLTRDYKFRELYCSTLMDAELEIGKRYNREAVKFQFDFLNDPIDGNLFEGSKIPKGLMDALKNNREIVLFMNPPYGTANDAGAKGTSKEGIAKTIINERMKNDGMGASSQQLYAQFIYRIMMLKEQYGLTNVYICMFTPTLYLSGGSFKKFRNKFLNEFEYIRGCTFQASHFSDVASNWGIGFTIWHNGETKDKNNFPHELVDYRDLDVEVIGHKDIYNVDGIVSASDWAKEYIKNLKTHSHVPMTSGVLWQGDNKDNRGAIFDNAIGYLLNKANKVEENSQGVALFSTTYGNGHGHGLNESNFTRCTALFTARRVIKGDWVNWADEYIAPDESNPKYKDFENDSIIFSIFESKSNQSSLRNITYRRNQYDIKNEFFFMKKDDILTLADENGYDHTYDDCKSSSERYVADLLFNKGLYEKLSPEAKEVLDKAIDMTRNTFSRREQFDDENSKYQIMNWDCGYYQLKELWKVYCPNDFKEFRESFKRLQDKLIPMVYELGFLKK